MLTSAWVVEGNIDDTFAHAPFPSKHEAYAYLESINYLAVREGAMFSVTVASPEGQKTRHSGDYRGTL